MEHQNRSVACLQQLPGQPAVPCLCTSFALVSDYSEEDIVEAMGGDDASVLDVVTFAMGIIQGAYPKNLQRSQP